MRKPKDAELYSSTAYLLKEERLDEGQLIQRMQLVKPWFTKEEVEAAIVMVKQIAV